MERTTKVVCPGCGARNATTAHRCRTCTRVINDHVDRSEGDGTTRDPDVAFDDFAASFIASWGSTPPSSVADLDADEGDVVDDAPPR